MSEIVSTKQPQSNLGECPMVLARVTDDPMHIGVVGGIGVLMLLSLPGWSLIPAGLALYAVANDVIWALTDDTDSDEKPAIDTEATEVKDPIAALKERSPDNWVDNSGLPEMWKPRVEPVEPVSTGFKRAADVVADSSPAELLALLGERAPQWLQSAAIAQEIAAAEPALEPEPPAVNTPEIPFEPMVPGGSGSGSGSVHGSGSGSVHGSDAVLAGLMQAVAAGPRVVPVMGVRGKTYNIVKTALQLEKSQTWIIENIFGVKKGGSTKYKSSVSYIRWVKENGLG